MRRWCRAVSETQRGIEGDGRRGRGHLVRVAAAAVMPGIVELPTLEELKVDEVRLIRGQAGGTGLQLPGGPTLGPGLCLPARLHPAVAPDTLLPTATGPSSC